ncbi:hypothetical protein APHAL10511_003802 [Amanita phalloides]|nr:hypothetical protein APHAL10511_003802 [Amanita phalloides]
MLPRISQLIASSEPVNLAYSIAGSSPYSGRYTPEKIITDNPSDHTSRWSSAYQGVAHQWILLRLESLSILQWVKFGKFSKPHPCNMKEFKVFVGMSEDHMIEVVHSGLRNDNLPENLFVRHVDSAGVYFPTRFVKVVPLSAHQSNFHTSIWHIALQGINDSDVVERVRRVHEEYREAVVLRHILKHLRQRRLLTPFDSILFRSFMKLEHPLVTELHTNVVLRGNWPQAEQLLDEFSSTGLFNSYLRSCQPYTTFKPLRGTDADGDVPCPRGGHAMCIDPVNDQIYLHGGFDGEKCLDDFWVYDVKKDKWKVLSLGTAQEQNAPGPRSCHKMVFDTKTGSIYLLGRLTDSDQLKPPATGAIISTTGSSTTPMQPTRQSGQFTHMQAVPLTLPATPTQFRAVETPRNYCSEFYRYHTRGLDEGKWDFLSFDTATSGGPPLIFDHQMVLDSEYQMLYVFGGRVIDGEWDSVKCSGMFCYNVRKSKWSCLMASSLPGNITQQGSIPPRFGHSMLLDPNTRLLYIFAGQREGIFLSDMYTFDLKTYTTTEIFPDSAAIGGPEPSFAQRAVIEPDLKEIYVISGLTSRDGEKSRISSHRGEMTYWVYRYGSQPGQWCKALLESLPEYAGNDTQPSSMTRPQSRYACQVVYNSKTKSIFIHGGNAGADEGPEAESSAHRMERSNSDDSHGTSASDAEKENQPEVDQRPKEIRLNDFWRIKLDRPGPEIITRRAKFLIRSQQYREMCEEQPPVKALNFLQCEVGEVVDHSNAKESDEFRSLMKHLLVPSANVGLNSRTSSNSTLRAGSTASARASTSIKEPNKKQEDHARAEKGSELLNRKSRIFELKKVDEGRLDDDDDIQDGEECSSDDEDDCDWTSDIPQSGSGEREDSGGNAMEDVGRTLFVNPDTLLDIPDAMEFRSRGKRAESAARGQEIPSGIRYQQRTEVFEALTEYIGEEDKQPKGSLLDLVGEKGVGGMLTGAHITTAESKA